MKLNNIKISDIYNGVWETGLKEGEKLHGDLEQSISFLNKNIRLHEDQKILEVGCGIGNLLDLLYHKGIKCITGVDISRIAAETGKEKYPFLNFSVMNAQNLGVRSNAVDVCISFDVAEHVFDINKYFSEIHRVLKKNGVYVFQTPNIITNSVSETIRWKGFRWKIHHPSLQFSWSLKRKLFSAGFSRIDLYKVSPVSEQKLKKISHRLIPLIKVIPWQRLPLFLQTNFWGIAWK